MKPVPNTTPKYCTIWPVGTKLRWIQRGMTVRGCDTIVLEYLQGTQCRGCEDCDGLRFKTPDGTWRCHYRKSESQHGLCYWEKVDDEG